MMSAMGALKTGDVNGVAAALKGAAAAAAGGKAPGGNANVLSQIGGGVNQQATQVFGIID